MIATPDGVTFKGSGEGITRLWLLKPDRTLATLVDRFVDFEMNLEVFFTGSIKVKVPGDHRMFDMEWDGINILERGLENWGCSFYYRDPGTGENKVFIGIADPLKIRHSGQRGSAYVEIEFNHAFWELMRRRQVWTQFGARWEMEDTPDNIARQLILTNCCADTVVTPNGNETDRTHFGPLSSPWVVTCDEVRDPGQHPETMKYSCDHGTVLTEALKDIFLGRMPRTGHPTDVYPYLRESTPGKFAVQILCGKDFVEPRVIGRDLRRPRVDAQSGAVVAAVLAPERKTILSFGKSWERTDQQTSIEVKGRGRGGSQKRFFVFDPMMVERVGVIENAWTAPEALDPDELELEARTYLGRRREGVVATEVDIIEWPGRMTYPAYVNLMDTITVYSGRDTFNILDERDVVGVTVKIPVPGYPHVSLKIGQLERNWLAEMGRHGGGRGGGGAGGGRPRLKAGAQDACEVAIACVQDDADEVCVERCGAKVKFLGDAWIYPAVRLPDPNDHGPGDTDAVVQLEWCAPICGDTEPTGPVIAMVQLCVTKSDGSQMIVAVPGYRCAAGAVAPTPPDGGPVPPLPPPPIVPPDPIPPMPDAVPTP